MIVGSLQQREERTESGETETKVIPVQVMNE